MARFRLSDRARKFLREVGSIVLGVLIALAIGEVADTLRHRYNAERGMAAVYRDMGASGVYFEERMLKAGCILRRLDELRSYLAMVRESGRTRNIEAIGRPNIRPLYTAGWATLVGSGEIMYVPKEKGELAKSYFSAVESYDNMQLQEQLSWSHLRVLEKRSSPVDDNLVADLEMAVEEARMHGMLLNRTARTMWLYQKSLGVKTDYGFFNDSDRQRLINDARSSAICRPL